eukprot:jgi/Chlat1/2603/Chrsp178S02498
MLAVMIMLAFFLAAICAGIATAEVITYRRQAEKSKVSKGGTGSLHQHHHPLLLSIASAKGSDAHWLARTLASAWHAILRGNSNNSSNKDVDDEDGSIKVTSAASSQVDQLYPLHCFRRTPLAPILEEDCEHLEHVDLEALC